MHFTTQEFYGTLSRNEIIDRPPTTFNPAWLKIRSNCGATMPMWFSRLRCFKSVEWLLDDGTTVDETDDDNQDIVVYLMRYCAPMYLVQIVMLLLSQDDRELNVCM